MKNIIIFMLLIALAANSYSQSANNGNTKKVNFYGFRYNEYQYPVELRGKFEPYYSMHDYQGYQNQGLIYIDAVNKTFKVNFTNGDDWVAINCKIEQKNENDPKYGDVIYTTYTGIWNDGERALAVLSIMKTNNNGCITEVKSRKVVDDDKKINTFKKIYVFATGGECFK